MRMVSSLDWLLIPTKVEDLEDIQRFPRWWSETLKIIWIEYGLVASFGRRWTVETPQRYLANQIITIYYTMIMGRMSANRNKYGWLLCNRAAADLSTTATGDTLPMQQKADDDFTQTSCWNSRIWQLKWVSDLVGIWVATKATPLQFRNWNRTN